MTDQPEFSFVLPCLNEEQTLEACVKKCRHSAEVNGFTAEILVADNGSTDNSIAIAKRLGCRVVNVAKKGYGSALISGIKNANGSFAVSYTHLTLPTIYSV